MGYISPIMEAVINGKCRDERIIILLLAYGAEKEQKSMPYISDFLSKHEQTYLSYLEHLRDNKTFFTAYDIIHEYNILSFLNGLIQFRDKVSKEKSMEETAFVQISKHNPAELRLLLEMGLNVNAKNDKDGKSLLRTAIESKFKHPLLVYLTNWYPKPESIDVINALIESGAEVDEGSLLDAQAKTGFCKFYENKKFNIVKKAYDRQKQKRMSAMKVDPPSAKDIRTNFAKPQKIQNKFQRFMQKLRSH